VGETTGTTPKSKHRCGLRGTGAGSKKRVNTMSEKPLYLIDPELDQIKRKIEVKKTIAETYEKTIRKLQQSEAKTKYTLKASKLARKLLNIETYRPLRQYKKKLPIPKGEYRKFRKVKIIIGKQVIEYTLNEEIDPRKYSKYVRKQIAKKHGIHPKQIKIIYIP